MICPSCNGEGKQRIAFPHNPEKCFITCIRCKGLKEVSDSTPEWIRKGKILKNQRIAKRITLRNVCKKFNLDPVKVSDMETGVVEPNMSLYDGL